MFVGDLWGILLTSYKRMETDNLNLRLKYLPKERIVRPKKMALQPIVVTLSANYWKLWIKLRLLERLLMRMSLLEITVKAWEVTLRNYAV